MAAPTKAALIRDALQKHPDMGPTEMARMLAEKHPDKTFTSQEISTNRTKLGLGKVKKSSVVEPEPAQALPARQDDIVEAMQGLKRAIDAFGRDQAKKLLDVL